MLIDFFDTFLCFVPLFVIYIKFHAIYNHFFDLFAKELYQNIAEVINMR